MSHTLADALLQAHGLYERGRFDDARALLLAVVEQAPEPVPSALMLLARMAEAEGRADESAEWLAAAAESAPADPLPLVGMASLALARGAAEDAEALLRQALARDRGCAPALSALGVVLLRRGRPDEAEAALRAAAAADPAAAAPHFHLGSLRLAAKDPAGAEACLRRAVRLAPDDADMALGLVLALRVQGAAADAVPVAERAAALRPDGATLTALGDALMEAGQAGAAEGAYGRALEAAPDHAPAHEGVARCRMAALDPDGAARSFRRALALEPQAWPLSVGLASALRAAGKLAAARDALEAAPEPAATIQRALLDLLEGKLQAGWQALAEAWRNGAVSFSPLELPGQHWDGGPLAGTLLVDCGLDPAAALMLMRFLPQARQRVGRLVVVCPETLRRLLAALPEVDAAVSSGEVPGGYDRHAALEVLPALLGAVEQPSQPPLPLPRSAFTRWQAVLHGTAPDRLRVGVWRRGAANTLGPATMLPAQCAAALAGHAGAAVFDLDAAQSAEGCQSLAGFADLADLGALLAQFDLVVAADGPALRLAAALGVPCLGIIPPIGDWIWGAEGEASPWLPSLRLRRWEGGLWSNGAAQLAAEAATMLAGGASV